MTQLTDDCFAFGGDLMASSEAHALLLARTPQLETTEIVPLDNCTGRILAEDLLSGLRVPAHDNAAVDGYAFRFADLSPDQNTNLKIAGRVAAGDDPVIDVPAGAAVRIFTGAVLPEGLDTVVMQEDVEANGETVCVPPGLKAGNNRRKAGEDTVPGDIVLQAGRLLRAQDLARAASIGVAELNVTTRPRIAIFSTGDELQDPGQDLPRGGVHDSNRHMLIALLKALPVIVNDLGILPDEIARVKKALADAAASNDLIITSGGVSTGEEDHIKGVVESLGALHFWRLAIKPGRPLALGRVGDAAFLGLPGNPVAVMVCFLRFGRAMTLRLAGAAAAATEPTTYSLPAAFSHSKKSGRREWLRASISRDANGQTAVNKFSQQGSGILRSLVETDGLVELPEELEKVEPGMLVEFLPYREVMA